MGPAGKQSTFLDISDEITAGRRAGPALGRVRAGLPALGPLLRRLHEQGRRHPRRRVPDRRRTARSTSARRAPCSRSTSRSRTTTAACSSSTTTATSSSASATAAPAATPSETARTSASCSGRSCGSIPSPQGSNEYSIPKDNPFAGQDGARPEILAYGLRNPWRFSFDRKTGALWIGDVGQNSLEEIDFVAELGAGANFGWSAFEGTERFNSDQEAPNAIDPVLTYGRDEGCSVTGGYVVRDRSLEDALRPLPLRRLLPGPAPQLHGRGRRPRARRRTTGRSASRCPRSRRSARTSEGGSTPSPWTGRCSGLCQSKD